MNLTISGRHLEITPAMREYVMNKLERVLPRFDHIIAVNVVLSVEKLLQKCEVTVHVRGKDIHVAAQEDDIYAAIDSLVDKLDRQMVKHKEKTNIRHSDVSLKNMPVAE